MSSQPQLTDPTDLDGLRRNLKALDPDSRLSPLAMLRVVISEDAHLKVKASVTEALAEAGKLGRAKVVVLTDKTPIKSATATACARSQGPARRAFRAAHRNPRRRSRQAPCRRRGARHGRQCREGSRCRRHHRLRHHDRHRQGGLPAERRLAADRGTDRGFRRRLYRQCVGCAEKWRQAHHPLALANRGAGRRHHHRRSPS